MPMNTQEALRRMREAGFVFDGAQDFITAGNIDRLAVAMDSAPALTAPNAGVPFALTAYVDPGVVEVQQAPRNSRKIFSEVKKGDWTTPSAIFRAVEMTGVTLPYTDFGNAGMADVNAIFPERQNYLAQTHIRYGELETAVAGKAMLNLVSLKQKSAANVIATDMNRFNLLGVQGKEIYGLLNEPNLPATLTPADVNGQTEWKDKSTVEIYNDVLSIFADIAANSNGLIDENSDFVFAAAPDIMVRLATATDFNVSVIDMLNKYFGKIEYVTIPELANNSAGNMVMLIARDVVGNKTGEFGFSEKMRALPLERYGSYYQQKYAFGTYGFILYYPYAIATMTGV